MTPLANSPRFIPKQPRRASPRIPGPFEARLVGDRSVAVRVRNLGTAGCLLDANELDEPLSTSMKLLVELPSEGWIAARVEAVYRLGRQEVAMKFVGLDAATRDRILREIQCTITEAGI
ncbi:MAG TPA: PilZ domain-containing protein [Vicinamibacterales bacterium]|jgi:hypothetical protein